MKPLLFIDVDGVLNPDKPGRYHVKYKIIGFKVWLNRNHGRHLLKLTSLYDLVWATTWKDQANEHIGPKIGLPELPFVDWQARYPSARLGGSLPMFKTIDIKLYASGRPFAWIDDDINRADIEELRDVECFPLPINSYTGITNADFKMLRDWGIEQNAKASKAHSAPE